MKGKWNLRPEQEVPPPPLQVTQVLLEYNGPQMVEATSRGQLYLGVASDELLNTTRWVFAPISNSDYQALLAGTFPVQEAFLKSFLVYILDFIGDQITSSWLVDPHSLHKDSLPDPGVTFLDTEISQRGGKAHES